MICREGVDSIGAALKELETKGYIKRSQLRDEIGSPLTSGLSS